MTRNQFGFLAVFDAMPHQPDYAAGFAHPALAMQAIDTAAVFAEQAMFIMLRCLREQFRPGTSRDCTLRHEEIPIAS